MKDLRNILPNLFLCLGLLILTSCSNQYSAEKSNPNSQLHKSDFIISNVVENTEKPKPENESFRQIPNEWKQVDFRNFKFPMVKLINGKFEERGEKNLGGTSYSLEDVYFVDLAGDSKKEAVALIWEVNCGGSCDGGSISFYFYKLEMNKPKLIDKLETGSRSGGCFVKSFKIEGKKVYLEQFGKCGNKNNFNGDINSPCKFCVKDLTYSTYKITESKLVRQSFSEDETDYENLVNYVFEIKIKE